MPILALLPPPPPAAPILQQTEIVVLSDGVAPPPTPATTTPAPVVAPVATPAPIPTAPTPDQVNTPVEVGTIGTVTTTAALFDPNLLADNGCDPSGCTAALTRVSCSNLIVDAVTNHPTKCNFGHLPAHLDKRESVSGGQK